MTGSCSSRGGELRVKRRGVVEADSWDDGYWSGVVDWVCGGEGGGGKGSDL